MARGSGSSSVREACSSRHFSGKDKVNVRKELRWHYEGWLVLGKKEPHKWTKAEVAHNSSRHDADTIGQTNIYGRGNIGYPLV